MRIMIVVAALALSLTACSSPAPVVERDEESFIVAMESFGGPAISMFSESDLIEAGDSMCESARESDRAMSEVGESLREYAINDQNASDDTLTYLSALIESSSAFLCPDLA
ncbi:MAG: hypothetical protein D3X82_01240 [Candidatus Leucobacter sulfamidivorax]|nr:hypothetical protein [Candidatus Leucobacter sulfamidivorax]